MQNYCWKRYHDIQRKQMCGWVNGISILGFLSLSPSVHIQRLRWVTVFDTCVSRFAHAQHVRKLSPDLYHACCSVCVIRTLKTLLLELSILSRLVCVILSLYQDFSSCKCEKVKDQSIYHQLGLNGVQLLRFFKKTKTQIFWAYKKTWLFERIILEGKVDGSRGRGRPRRQWMDDIAEWLNMDFESPYSGPWR